jgi:hypothetical protein
MLIKFVEKRFVHSSLFVFVTGAVRIDSLALTGEGIRKEWAAGDEPSHQQLILHLESIYLPRQ